MDFCMDTADTIMMNLPIRKLRDAIPLKLKDEFIKHFV